jgi:hypothetical protein
MIAAGGVLIIPVGAPVPTLARNVMAWANQGKWSRDGQAMSCRVGGRDIDRAGAGYFAGGLTRYSA